MMTQIHDIAVLFQATPAARLDSLRTYFSDVPVRLNQLFYFVLIFVVVALLLFLAKLIFKLVRKNHGEPEFLSVSNSASIVDALKNLEDTGGRMDFRFTGTDGRQYQGDGTIIRMDAGELVIEWLRPPTNTETWIGQKIECYFRANDEKTKRHSLFAVAIKSVTSVGSKRIHITIPLPEKLESRQKRATLRIMPPDEAILSMSIWEVKGTDLPVNEGKLGEPAMLYLPEDTSQFSLEDLSAGGVRIALPYKKKELFPAAPKNDSVFYFMITLRGHSPNELVRYTMLCQVRAARSVPQKESIILGCQFLSYAQQSSEVPGLLRWKKLENNTEILSLSNWIFKSHLDIYRRKGIDISR